MRVHFLIRANCLKRIFPYKKIVEYLRTGLGVTLIIIIETTLKMIVEILKYRKFLDTVLPIQLYFFLISYLKQNISIFENKYTRLYPTRKFSSQILNYSMGDYQRTTISTVCNIPETIPLFRQVISYEFQMNTKLRSR